MDYTSSRWIIHHQDGSMVHIEDQYMFNMDKKQPRDEKNQVPEKNRVLTKHISFFFEKVESLNHRKTLKKRVSSESGVNLSQNIKISEFHLFLRIYIFV